MNSSTCILLIEDDPAVAQSLSAGLEREGYSVTWKTLGAEGVAYASQHQPQLVILDMRLPHLFERFHRGRNASAYPGSGLGLAIVRALVTSHGGRIYAESEAGRGTRMTVNLPTCSRE